ncbi:MAG: DEAD/DEAH box helicase family protein [Gammaproteobacteria bacterium]|nr:DEAD/DEAH box helicase family protein [Gammaproteobacteria bacterium]MBU2685760.1 DEAD/DEAH box helicase family protein [Gammaproteobacteria bacterium]
MSKVRVEEINPVWSTISNPELIRDVFIFEAEFWRQGPYRKEPQTYKKSLLYNRNKFHTGHMARVLEILDRKDVESEAIINDYKVDAEKTEPNLIGKELRDYQQVALAGILEAKRGTWTAPTRSGKTPIMAAVIDCFNLTALIIVHTKDLYEQTKKELSEMLGVKIGEISQKIFDLQDVTVAMKQTLANRIEKGSVPKGFEKRWGIWSLMNVIMFQS